MNPAFRFEVSARDRYSEVFDRLTKKIQATGNVADRVDKGFGRWNKTSQRIAKPLTQLERVLDHMGKGFGLERFTRTFGLFGRATADVLGGFETGTAGIGEAVAGLGSAGEAAAGSLGSVGAAAVAAAGPISVTVGAVVAGGAAVATAAHQWDASGAALLRFSKLVGEPVVPLQTLIGSMEQAGLTADEAKSTILGLSRAVASAGFPGENPKALGIMNLERWTPPAPGEPVDVDLWNARLAALMAKQRSPKVRAEIAQAFGVPDAATSYYSQGPQQIASDRATSAATMRPLTQAELERAARDNAQWALLGQASSGVGRSLGATAANMAQPFLGPATRAASGLSWLTDKLDIGPLDLLMPGLQHGIASVERDILPWAQSRLSGLTAGEAARGGPNVGEAARGSADLGAAGKDTRVLSARQAALADMIRQEAAAAGMPDPETMVEIARRESGLRADPPPNSRSSARGLFEFLRGSAQHYGIDPRDPQASARAAMQLVKDALGEAYGASGKHYTRGDEYLAMFLGPRGLTDLFRASPNAIAATATPGLERAARTNPEYFGLSTPGHLRNARTVAELEAYVRGLVARSAPLPASEQAKANPAPPPAPQPQTVDVTVRFQNAPQGTIVESKASPQVKLKIGKNNVGSG